MLRHCDCFVYVYMFLVFVLFVSVLCDCCLQTTGKRYKSKSEIHLFHVTVASCLDKIEVTIKLEMCQCVSLLLKETNKNKNLV